VRSQNLFLAQCEWGSPNLSERHTVSGSLDNGVCGSDVSLLDSVSVSLCVCVCFYVQTCLWVLWMTDSFCCTQTRKTTPARYKTHTDTHRQDG